ncbi:MAG: type IV secretion system DNA-binding domain-containing protein [Clostridia bacterium]|nr:type IV secretion system DNA-binding domain-containing protein [Clostridia bacterium]
MAYYLIITFIIFILIDYKYIYSYIDSRFLYTTSGSKLNQEINKSKNKRKNCSYDKLDVYIFILVFLIAFSLNYTISSIAFNTNPLTIKIISKINLRELMQGYEDKFKFVYHTSYAICILVLTNEYRDKLKAFVIGNLNKLLGKEKAETKEEVRGYIVARDENDECFSIEEETLYKNVLITGSIGSGKTSGAIARLTYDLIKSGKGGLILDVKGNFVDTVDEMCKRLGRTKDMCIISKNSSCYFELLDKNVSSLELANRLKQVITLLSTNNNSDSYWLDKVENVLMNMIILMKHINQLDLMTLHRLVSEDLFLKETLAKIKNSLKEKVPSDKMAFELAGAISFIENEYFKLDSRVNTIIKSEITRLTIPLVTDYDIYNQFCIQNGKQKISFSVNKIIVLSINIGENKALAKIIATFIKLAYQKHILSNISSSIPSFFIADEFQEFCNSDDAQFLSLSREAKCINIISTQSYSSLKNTLKDKNAANVIIQNLVNKIWFRNDDNYTISEAVKQLGKVNVTKENRTISESGQESKKNMLGTGFRNKKSSISKSLNYVLVKENEYDENFFSRELKTFEALTFISTNEGIVTKKVIFERWK